MSELITQTKYFGLISDEAEAKTTTKTMSPSKQNFLSSSACCFSCKTMTGVFYWSCIDSASSVLLLWLSSALLLPPVPPAALNALTSHLEAFRCYLWGFLLPEFVIHVKHVSNRQPLSGAVCTQSKEILQQI